jgi:molybdenum cofactor cytidylyltransferase
MIAPSFAGVILAAGQSSRMGSDKALLTWRGKSFLTAAIDSLKPVTQLVMVVTGQNSETLKPLIWANAAYLVINPNPEQGQFKSLQVGLHEVLNNGRDAAIITHVDRPPAAAATLQKLIDSFALASPEIWAVVPEFGGKHGHPIVIGREMIEAFLRAEPGPPENPTTARDIEHANQQHILYLPVDDAAVTTNVNTPEEYAELASR